MSLPRLDLPKYTCVLPISKQKVEYRSFTVREEKILLIAKETEDIKQIITSVLQVADNCTFGKLDINALASIDLEFLYLQLRIKSVGEISELRYKCTNKIGTEESYIHCKGIISHEIDLTKITPSNTDVESKINLTDTVGIKFTVPTIDTIGIILNDTSGADVDIDFLYSILDYIWDNEEVHPKSDITREEFSNWIQDLKSDQFEKIEKFTNNLPRLSADIELVCPECKNKTNLTLEGLSDFF